MTKNSNLTKLSTVDGKNIYNQEHVKQLRKKEDGKKNSNHFIAQKGAQEFGLSSDVDIIVFGGNRGGGKANPYNTPVATPSGFRKMGDLEVGDLICTPYNGVQKVSDIFEQGINTVYVLHFDDGTTVDCMDNHRFWARTAPDEDFHEMTAREIFDIYKLGVPYPLSLRHGKKHYVDSNRPANSSFFARIYQWHWILELRTFWRKTDKGFLSRKKVQVYRI